MKDNERPAPQGFYYENNGLVFAALDALFEAIPTSKQAGLLERFNEIRLYLFGAARVALYHNEEKAESVEQNT